MPLVDQLVPVGLPLVLVVGIHGGAGLVPGLGHDLVEQFLVKVGVGIVKLGLADLLHHPVDEGDLLLDLVKGQLDALQHGLVIHLVGAGLDHDHLLAGGDHGGGHVGLVALRLVGVEDDLAVHQTHADAAHRAVPGNVRDGEGSGGADGGGDLRLAVIVHAQHGADHSDVVAKVRGEQGPDGTVNAAGGQHGVQAGTALTAHERAGDAAHGIQLLLKVHAQREEVHSVTGTGRSGGSAEHGGLAVLDDDGGVGQLADLAHLQSQRLAAEIHLVLFVIGELAMGDNR